MNSEIRPPESCEAIPVDHEQSSTADGDTLRQGEFSEEAQSRAPGTNSNGISKPQGAATSSSNNGAVGTKVAPGLPIRRRGKATKGKTGKAIEEYRHVFNHAVGNVVDPVDDSEPLPPSQIGASYWTSSEKSIFFAKLAVYGPTALSKLSSAIGTKSTAEVGVYIELLQDGLSEVTATPANTFSGSVMPIAYEVHPGLEKALDEFAGSLAGRIEELDSAREQVRYGEEWLIDEEVAEALEAAHEDDDTSQDNDGDDRPVPCRAPDSAGLLRAPAFVTLSTNVFMNAPLGHQENWRELDVDESTGPAIYRSAFDDFRNLAVSLTRRLVAAAIFQATSRLRASCGSRGNWKPVAEVITADIRAAAETLSLRNNWHVYWAKLPRRLGLSLVTDIRKYKDGRPGAKGGVTLNPNEAEEELGLVSQGLEDHAPAREDSDGDVGLDSDDFTEVSVLGDTPGADEDLEVIRPDPEVDFKTFEFEARANGQQNKRKRASSNGEYDRAEDAHLGALDAFISRHESERLAEMLGVDIEETVQQMSPERLLLERRVVDSVVDHQHWTVNTQYVSQWEHSRGWPDAASFAQMQALGKARGRKRRRLREEAVARGPSHSAGTNQESSLAT